MMKRAALMGWAVGWLGVTSVLAQVQVEIQVPAREPGVIFQRPIVRPSVTPNPRRAVEAKNPERERTIRFQIAQLVGRQFDLDESQVAKLKTAWDSEPVPLVKEDFQSRRSLNRTPVRVLDDLLLSRDGVLALTEVLDRRQLIAFFESVQSRKDQAVLAASNRMALAVDSILCLLPEQREKVGMQLWTTIRSVPSNSERLLMEPASLFNAAYFGRSPILEQLLSKRQKEIWNLVKSNHSQIWSLLTRIRAVARMKEHQERVIIQGVGRPVENELRLEPPQPALDRPAKMNQTRIEAMDRHLEARIEAANLQLETTQNGLVEVALAGLEAHIESLGELDEATTRRLKLAAQGTVRQVREELKAETSEKSELQTPSREERALAAVQAKMLFSTSGKSQGYFLSFWRRILTGLHDYPLYRTTIEEVLSPEGYADYQAVQAEKEEFRLTAARRAALAALDLRLLLTQDQKRHIETRLERIDAELSVLGMVFEVGKSPDKELFNEWQRNELTTLFAEPKELNPW